MKTRLALALCVLAVPANVNAQQQVIERPHFAIEAKPITLQLDAIEMGQLVTMLLRDVMRVPYAISPDVVKDRRPASVNLRIPRGEKSPFVIGFLRSVGYVVDVKAKAIHVSKGDFDPSPETVADASFLYSGGIPVTHSEVVPSSWAAPSPPQINYNDRDPSRSNISRSRQQNYSRAETTLQNDLAVIVRPAYRSPADIVPILETLFDRLKIAYREGIGTEGTGLVQALAPEYLAISGPETDVRRAVQMIEQLDRARPMVRLTGAIVEVSDVETKGSALSVLASLFSDTIGLGSLSNGSPADTFASIEIAGVKAVLSAVRGNSRFRIVAEPSLSAISGATASLNAGSQVPTLGAISFGEDGNTVQSVEYRDSGLTLQVTPIVRDGLIELTVNQERSNFVTTTTGVNESPTLNRSTASSVVSLQAGGIIALAGLSERSQGNTTRGLFGGLLGSKTRDKSSSELLIVLQADVEDVPTGKKTSVFEYPALSVNVPSAQNEQEGVLGDVPPTEGIAELPAL